jgi:hypothetical protein
MHKSISDYETPEPISAQMLHDKIEPIYKGR